MNTPPNPTTSPFEGHLAIEAELRESEARFRAAFENSTIGIGLLDLDGRIRAANATVCEMSGYSEQELKQRTDNQNVYPADLDIGRDLHEEMLAGRLNSYTVEKRYIRKNGQVFWARLTLSLVRGEAGQPLYLVGLIEDIDSQKQTVAELRESEARFRAMFENTAVGVSLMTLDRRIVQINPTVTRITGYTDEDMASLDPTTLIYPEDRLLDRELFAELIAGKREQYLMEKRYIHKDGHLFWGRINFALVRDADAQPLYIVGILEDISEEKRAAERLAAQEENHRRLLEQRIAQRTEELNLANERLRDTAAREAVAAERTRLARDLHDAVTQTLFSTTLIADVLPEIWDKHPEEGLRRLEELRQLTRGALAEMRMLLVELRPNALIEVPLATLLRQLTEAMVGRSRINIQFNADGERQLPADVQVGLYRIAQEALNNVVKHAKARQAFVTLRLGDSVRLVIADDGMGFDPGTITADHLGVKIMHERAAAIAAIFHLHSGSGQGTQISVTWESDDSL
jgi:two-component system nitrate/nitrite sensor histidine kinase NarX